MRTLKKKKNLSRQHPRMRLRRTLLTSAGRQRKRDVIVRFSQRKQYRGKVKSTQCETINAAAQESACERDGDLEPFKILLCYMGYMASQ